MRSNVYYLCILFILSSCNESMNSDRTKLNNKLEITHPKNVEKPDNEIKKILFLDFYHSMSDKDFYQTIKKLRKESSHLFNSQGKLVFNTKNRDFKMSLYPQFNYRNENNSSLIGVVLKYDSLNTFAPRFHEYALDASEKYVILFTGNRRDMNNQARTSVAETVKITYNIHHYTKDYALSIFREIEPQYFNRITYVSENYLSKIYTPITAKSIDPYDTQDSYHRYLVDGSTISAELLDLYTSKYGNYEFTEYHQELISVTSFFLRTKSGTYNRQFETAYELSNPKNNIVSTIVYTLKCERLHKIYTWYSNDLRIALETVSWVPNPKLILPFNGEVFEQINIHYYPAFYNPFKTLEESINPAVQDSILQKRKEITKDLI